MLASVGLQNELIETRLLFTVLLSFSSKELMGGKGFSFSCVNGPGVVGCSLDTGVEQSVY